MIHDYEPDDELMSRLGEILARVDPVPEDVVAAAKASATWRTIDTELATLSYDSVLDRNELIGVRGGGSRLLTFTSPGITVELEVLGGGRGLIGQIGGTAADRVEICFPHGAQSVETDALGHFSLSRPHRGPMSVRVTDDGAGTVFQTEWVVI